METKKCNRCKKDKVVDDFGLRSKLSKKRLARCKECLKEVSAELYLTSETRSEKIKNRAKEMSRFLSALINRYKEMKGCNRCKNKFRYYLLDLHHVDPKTKDINISKLVQRSSKNKLKEELKKCIVLCCICHREVHFEKGILE